MTNFDNIPMTSLNFYHNGSCVTKNGIDSFDFNGQTFKCDDLVVVADGQIGNIEKVNIDAGVCSLGMSLVYADVMARRPWSLKSGHRCLLDGIRHATDEEKRLYGLDENRVYDAAEEYDMGCKNRFINW